MLVSGLANKLEYGCLKNTFQLLVWAVGCDSMSILVCIIVIQDCLTFDLLLKQISYHGSEEGGESEDSEGENQELAQIDRGECVCVCVATCIYL